MCSVKDCTLYNHNVHHAVTNFPCFHQRETLKKMEFRGGEFRGSSRGDQKGVQLSQPLLRNICTPPVQLAITIQNI